MAGWHSPALRHPVVIGAVSLAAIIVIATYCGPAAWSDALRSLLVWRRPLMLSLALFFDAPSKRLLPTALVETCVTGMA
jgi:hypothetical protein